MREKGDEGGGMHRRGDRGRRRRPKGRGRRPLLAPYGLAELDLRCPKGPEGRVINNEVKLFFREVFLQIVEIHIVDSHIFFFFKQLLCFFGVLWMQVNTNKRGVDFL